MKIRDLGELVGPVLAFGGPCSNLQATRALIAEAARRGIAPGNCICTGDVVAYCADPAATVGLIRDFGCPVIAGNVERQLGAGAGSCGCGFDPGTACDRMSAAWYAHADAAIGPADREWMAELPDWITFSHAGRTHAVVHGGGSDVARFLWPVTTRVEFAREWDLIERAAGPVDVVIAGHSGLPFIHEFSFGTWINAGVIGMPPHDGTPRTAFALLQAAGPSLHRLDYDHDTAADAMVAEGLTQGYDAALRTGYWPSEEVLPEALRVSSRASG